MITLPATTLVNRVVAKEKFYTKTAVNTRLQKLFTNEIEKIVWKHKIAADTLNITAGKAMELQVFEITLKGRELHKDVLRHIDLAIPYPVLFLLKRGSEVQATMSYKTPSPKLGAPAYLHVTVASPWQSSIALTLQGHSVDACYRNYLRQLEPMLQGNTHEQLLASIERYQERQSIEKQIAVYQKKITKEPSIAKKQELARERYELQMMLEKEGV